MEIDTLLFPFHSADVSKRLSLAAVATHPWLSRGCGQVQTLCYKWAYEMPHPFPADGPPFVVHENGRIELESVVWWSIILRILQSPVVYRTQQHELNSQPVLSYSFVVRSLGEYLSQDLMMGQAPLIHQFTITLVLLSCIFLVNSYWSCFVVVPLRCSRLVRKRFSFARECTTEK